MRFTDQVKRTWSLVRVYWGTPDYDWSTIALLMRHQIKRTREHIAKHKFMEKAEDDSVCRQMALTETLLTRALDGEYDFDRIARVMRHMPEWWD